MENRPYNFEEVLGALQIILMREALNNYPRREPEFGIHVRPLVITLDGFLINLGILDKDRRRAIRLAMLSIITKQHVETTYDLSSYQCTNILTYLSDHLSEERAGRFLGDLASRAESKVAHGEGQVISLDGWVGMDRDLSDLS